MTFIGNAAPCVLGAEKLAMAAALRRNHIRAGEARVTELAQSGQLP
jgi:hypothetical protein